MRLEWQEQKSGGEQSVNRSDVGGLGDCAKAGGF